MNLECRFKWEKEIAEGDDYVLACLEIVSAHIDERHLDESDLGRTSETGHPLQHPPPHPPGAFRRDGPTTIWAWCRKYGTMRNTENSPQTVFWLLPLLLDRGPCGACMQNCLSAPGRRAGSFGVISRPVHKG